MTIKRKHVLIVLTFIGVLLCGINWRSHQRKIWIELVATSNDGVAIGAHGGYLIAAHVYALKPDLFLDASSLRRWFSSPGIYNARHNGVWINHGGNDEEQCYTVAISMFELIIAAFMFPAFMCWRLVATYIKHRRTWAQIHKKKCGYDLTGNVSGICPECGETIPGNYVHH